MAGTEAWALQPLSSTATLLGHKQDERSSKAECGLSVAVKLPLQKLSCIQKDSPVLLPESRLPPVAFPALILFLLSPGPVTAPKSCQLHCLPSLPAIQTTRVMSNATAIPTPRQQHSNPQRRQQEQCFSRSHQLSRPPAGSGTDLVALVTSCACTRCSFFRDTGELRVSCQPHRSTGGSHGPPDCIAGVGGRWDGATEKACDSPCCCGGTCWGLC